MTAPDELERAAWRTSSFSSDRGECVQAAALADGTIAVRNSNHPEAGVLLFTRPEVADWLQGCKAGEFDELSH